MAGFEHPSPLPVDRAIPQRTPGILHADDRQPIDKGLRMHIGRRDDELPARIDIPHAGPTLRIASAGRCQTFGERPGNVGLRLDHHGALRIHEGGARRLAHPDQRIAEGHIIEFGRHDDAPRPIDQAMQVTRTDGKQAGRGLRRGELRECHPDHSQIEKATQGSKVRHGTCSVRAAGSAPPMRVRKCARAASRSWGASAANWRNWDRRDRSKGSGDWPCR